MSLAAFSWGVRRPGGLGGRVVVAFVSPAVGFMAGPYAVAILMDSSYGQLAASSVGRAERLLSEMSQEASTTTLTSERFSVPIGHDARSRRRSRLTARSRCRPGTAAAPPRLCGTPPGIASAWTARGRASRLRAVGLCRVGIRRSGFVISMQTRLKEPVEANLGTLLAFPSPRNVPQLAQDVTVRTHCWRRRRHQVS